MSDRAGEGHPLIITFAGKGAEKRREHEDSPNIAYKFRGNKTDCTVCPLREKCLRYPDRSQTRQVYFFRKPESFTENMKQRIDSIKGRLIYNRRLPTIEPIFANVRSTLGFDRFTLRGKKKVNIPGSFIVSSIAFLRCIAVGMDGDNRNGKDHPLGIPEGERTSALLV